jgi:hypothetical protein
MDAWAAEHAAELFLCGHSPDRPTMRWMDGWMDSYRQIHAGIKQRFSLIIYLHLFGCCARPPAHVLHITQKKCTPFCIHLSL